MQKTLQKILTGAIILMGTAHVSLTFFSFDSLTPEAIWFAAAGVAMIFAGFLNIIRLREIGKDNFVKILCTIANFVMILLFIALMFIFPAPHIVVGTGLFAAELIFSVFGKNADFSITDE